MSGDEIFVLVISIVMGVYGWQSLILFKPFPRSATRFLGYGTPLFCAAILFYILRRWSSEDVRNDSTYLCFYMVVGFGWLGIMNRLLPYVGLLCRDDALERGNTAAGLASSGALTGLTLAFAGGNIGTGPGWWVVLFCAGLATAALLLLWMVGNGISRTEEAITIDRDLAAGWRALGFFVGGGLIVGRAVAGDWSSVGGTLRDFARQGWMVVVLTAVSVAVDQLTRPTPEKPAPNVFLHGLLPCLLYLAVGILTVMRLGSW